MSAQGIRFLGRRLHHGWRVARALFSSQYALMLEYRAETALWALSGILPFIMLGIWGQLADAPAGSGPVTSLASGIGLDRVQLSRYFLCAFVARQFSVAWVVYAFEEDALQGRLSPYLLQPLQPLWRYVAAHLAEQVTRLPFVLLIAALFFLLQPEALWIPTAPQILATVLAIWMAFTLNFLLQSCIAILCFWSERANALERLLFIPYLFLSGLVAPLEVFPPALRAVAHWTPFPYMVAFPAQLLSGAPVPVAASFTAMVLWIALLLPTTLLLWRAGVRRYSAMGA
jgi:ABC-2 type transport system permease protein